MTADIILTGREILERKVEEKNGYYAISKLLSEGYDIRRVVITGDVPEIIGEEIKRSINSVEILIVSGGLGGTSDDTMRGAFEKMGVKLRKSALAQAHLERILKERGREVRKIEEKIFFFPEDSTELRNPAGLALGIMWRKGITTCFFLPGVPEEFRVMFDLHILPFLRRKKGQTFFTRRWTFFGVREVEINERIESMENLKRIQFSYLPDYPLLHIEGRVIGRDEKACEKMLNEAEDFLLKIAGEHFFYRDFSHPVEELKVFFKKRGITLSTAESCTGGLLASMITDVPGASEYFLGGSITYTDEEKVRELGIERSFLKEYGAVSAEVAEEMCRRIKNLTGSSWSVSTTGYAGPEGGDEKNPVGTVYVGVCDEDGRVTSSKFQFRGDRIRLKKSFALSALFLLLKLLKEKYRGKI